MARQIRTVTLEIVVDVHGEGDLIGAAHITSILANQAFVKSFRTVSEVAGEPEATEFHTHTEVQPEDTLNG